MSTENSVALPLASVQPGARLAAAVLGADGQVLMTAGAILTEAALKKLAQRGIAAVAIAVETRRDEAELVAAREALRQRLGHLFRKCDMQSGDRHAQMLYRAVLDYRLEALR